MTRISIFVGEISRMRGADVGREVMQLGTSGGIADARGE